MIDISEKVKLFFEETVNLNRSLVGSGINIFFQKLKSYIPIEIIEFESGYKAFDWEVPKGWDLIDGGIFDSKGKPIITTDLDPLCVWTNSVPVSMNISKKDLFKNHISWVEEYPDAIPYNYKYYEKKWGFSISKNMISEFVETDYTVNINARHYNDSLKVGRYIIKGKSEKSIIIACHVDHPYQLLDGLSGAGGAIALIENLEKNENLFTYVFLFFPETIGSLAYFSLPNSAQDVCYAIFLDMLSDSSKLTVQRSLKGDTAIDRVSEIIGKKWKSDIKFTSFRELPGNDEMVINGPGIGIPSLLVFRWPSKLYHTNADSMNAYNENNFFEAIDYVMELLKTLENEIRVVNVKRGIINLSKNQLWDDYGKGKNRRSFEIATSLMDGTHSYDEIKISSGFNGKGLDNLITKLEQRKLVVTCLN